MRKAKSRQARHFTRNNKRCADIVRLALQDIVRQHQTRADAPIQPIRTREDYQTAIVDLLANIRHFCSLKGIAFEEADASANRHFRAEIAQSRTGEER